MNKTRKIGLSLVGAVAGTLMAYNVANDFWPAKNLWGDLHGLGRCDITGDSFYFGSAGIWYTETSGLLVSPRALVVKDLSKKVYVALINRGTDPSSTNPKKIEELNKHYVKVWDGECRGLVDVFGSDPGRYVKIESFYSWPKEGTVKVEEGSSLYMMIITDPSRRMGPDGCYPHSK